jgi:hypothetical protein
LKSSCLKWRGFVSPLSMYTRIAAALKSAGYLSIKE